MKLFLSISFLLFILNPSTAQKVRLEGDKSNYLCLNDSIAETFELMLKKNRVDSTISILYDYDNGRLSSSTRVVIWTQNGISRIRIIQGCNQILKDTTHTYDLTDLWNYIKITHFEDVSIPIKSGTGQSHDKFYHITVKLPTRSFFVVVRNNERKKNEKHQTPESDSRVMLTNKIDEILRLSSR